MRLHSISAGDLLRAFRILDARDDATRTAIARALGFHLPDATRPRSPHHHEKPSLPPTSDEPLFNPQWTRAMISTMARIRTRTGPPEIESLVAAAAERQPMLSLALSISETASGADVLLDIGETPAMHLEDAAAFSREQARLVQMMRRVLGRGMVSTFQFRGSPARGLAAYRPARPGWPVIVLTDLGIGRGETAAPASEWLDFSRQVRSAGCHLLALVPHPPPRWPADLASSMRIVHWSRTTTVRTIRNALV